MSNLVNEHGFIMTLIPMSWSEAAKHLPKFNHYWNLYFAHSSCSCRYWLQDFMGYWRMLCVMLRWNLIIREFYILVYHFQFLWGIGALLNTVETISMRLLKYLDTIIIGSLPLPFFDGTNCFFFSRPTDDFISTEHRAKHSSV